MKIPYIVPRDVEVPTSDHWHEGTSLLGYWHGGDSYVFRGNNGHALCVSREFMEEMSRGELTSEVAEVVG